MSFIINDIVKILNGFLKDALSIRSQYALNTLSIRSQYALNTHLILQTSSYLVNKKVNYVLSVTPMKRKIKP
jgi:hypothetical protein